ncbi:D-glycero-beta-D-manno-heptose-7-phosphate kinase [Bacteroidetes/Chlorobi group bacterium ChocPot_Mid]|jgi:rfaE bifunctional protein kinase chain/domain|nr:MAG: D-glycero-beta-D-manno-heptose-7-phosphate kinase [Bacteroidetes/Chlorobi group bacterium ChocPot_Mid]
MTIETLKSIIATAQGKTIAVIGDVMLDRFFWGSVSRISPEAPVPVVDVEDESFHLGGAANVANNLKSLGLNPILFGIIGNDLSGEKFIDIANESGINPKGLFKDKDRPTTVKTRIIGNNQHIVRLDREVRTKINTDAEVSILSTFKSDTNISGVIFGDYNKGTISQYLIDEITSYANQKAIPVYVDPKYDNFFAYKNSTFFKPNKKEASTALNKEIKSSEDLINAGKNLMEMLLPKNLLLTLGAKGMMLFESSGEIWHVPTIARHIADVSGAGDTAIATLAAATAGGASAQDAAMLANYASGAVCELPGIVPITPDLLTNAIKKSNNLFLSKVFI